MEKFISTDDYFQIVSQIDNIIRIKDYPVNENGLIIRHDVDFSVDVAFNFSRLEKRENILSTYYFLLTSDLYNIFSIENSKKIYTMLEDGFEIGIHFNPFVYGDVTDEKLLQHFLDEVRMFESYFGSKIFSYSTHEPSIHGKFPDFNKFINAYNTDIFSNDCYISDSMFSFRNKNPFEFVLKANTELVQFLSHPIHYLSDGIKTYEDSLNILLNNYYSSLNKDMNVSNVYRNQIEYYNIKLLKQSSLNCKKDVK